MNSIRQHGADDIVTSVRFLAVCKYCGRLLECMNAEDLHGSDLPNVEQHADVDPSEGGVLQPRLEWAHRHGPGSYRRKCRALEYIGEHEGDVYERVGVPRLAEGGTVAAYWTIIVSVNGTDRFGVRAASREDAKERVSKILIWNPA